MAHADLMVALTAGTKSHHTADDQAATTLEIVGGDHKWPMHLEGYLGGGWDSDRNSYGDPLRESSYEFGVGLGRSLDLGAFRPHVGAGVARAWSITHQLAGGESPERRFHASAYRPWLTLEALLRIGPNAVFGGTARWSEFKHIYPSLGGTLLGITVGWSSSSGPR